MTYSSGDANHAATQCLTCYLLPRQLWLTPVQGLCIVTQELLAMCVCETLHATRAAIKTKYGQQLSVTHSSGDANMQNYWTTAEHDIQQW